MSGKAKRGKAYQCTKCDWRGESSWGLEHYCKKHCEGATESPYFCEDCKYAAATTGQIQRHQKGEKHRRKTANGGGHVRYNSDIEIVTWLIQLSQEKSQAIWAARVTTPTPSQQGLNDTLQSMEDDAVSTGTSVPECSLQKPYRAQASKASQPPSKATPRLSEQWDKEVSPPEQNDSRDKEATSKSSPPSSSKAHNTSLKSKSNTQHNDKPQEDQETWEATEVLEKINREMSNDIPQAPKENSRVPAAYKAEGLQAPKENSRVPAADKAEDQQVDSSQRKDKSVHKSTHKPAL